MGGSKRSNGYISELKDEISVAHLSSHVPPQEFADMLMSVIKNRIQKYKGERFCFILCCMDSLTLAKNFPILSDSTRLSLGLSHCCCVSLLVHVFLLGEKKNIANSKFLKL